MACAPVGVCPPFEGRGAAARPAAWTTRLTTAPATLPVSTGTSTTPTALRGSTTPLRAPSTSTTSAMPGSPSFRWGSLGAGRVPRTQAPGHSPRREHSFSGSGWGQGLWRRLQEPLGGPESACPSATSSGHHAGGLGRHHVLCDGCSFLLQLHLLHPPHHRE